MCKNTYTTTGIFQKVWYDARTNSATRFSQLLNWSHRLMVRTPGFHPGNRGSIPRGITTYFLNKKHREVLFVFENNCDPTSKCLEALTWEPNRRRPVARSESEYDSRGVSRGTS